MRSLNKTFYIFLFFILFCCEAKTQTNLVYNGDFEIYDTCPANISTPGDLQIEHCLGWTTPHKLGTSDYFNVCNNSTTFHFVGVPKNLLGFQMPYNGNAYCGLIPWMFSTSDINYREYLQTKLTQKLQAGKSYNLSFYVSNYGYGYSLEKIGALFSQNDFSENSWTPITSNPQIINDKGVIVDSLNWIKIEGEFNAKGGEEYLTIGYFVDSLLVKDTVNTLNDSFPQMISYYYVDGVSLLELPCTNNLPNVFTPNGDNVNDVFKLTNCGAILNTSIYNRWGNLVFQTENQNHFWDGRTTSGEECVDGIYYYIIETKEKTLKGFIQLIR